MDYIQNIFSEAGNITSFMTLSITILGAFSLLLSNLARYVQASKFGIPVKAMHQASVGDSIGIWVTLVGTLGFGIFIPFLLLYSNVNGWIIYAAMVASCFLGLVISKCYNIGGKDKERKFDDMVFVTETDITWRCLAVLSPIFAIAYMRVRNMYNHVYIEGYEIAFAEGFFASLRLYAAFFGLGIYALMITLPLIYNVKEKLFGGLEKMVTEIDGQLYLVAMRNSQYHWILIPCVISKVEYMKTKSGGSLGTNYMRFEKGKFLLCDMSHPPMEIKRLIGYTLIEKGVPKKEA